MIYSKTKSVEELIDTLTFGFLLPVFREHYLQSQSYGRIPDPPGDPQLASGNETVLHRVLDRHSAEPVPGKYTVCQLQPAQM